MSTPEQWYALALSHVAARRFAEAEAACRQILRVHPNHADTHNLLGLAKLRGGKPEQALKDFRHALKINPRLVATHLNCGLAAIELGKPDDARKHFRTALRIDPRAAEAHFQLGVLAQRQFRYDEALAHMTDCLAVDPTRALAQAIRGETLLLLGRLAEARAALEQASAISTNIPNVYDNLGLIAENERRPYDALASFERALALNPDLASAHFNRAVTLLRRGDLPAGLPEFEWRWRVARTAILTKVRPFPQPRWQGEPLNGRKLLIWGEQGVGDEIRLAALARDLTLRGESIVLECDPRLVTLFARSMPQATIVARRDPPDPATADAAIAFQIPAESAIQFVRPTLDAFPKRSHFLVADSQRRDKIRAELTAKKPGAPIVGVSWGSYNPQMLHGKSSPLAAWAPVLSTENVHFVRLQEFVEGRDGSAPDMALRGRMSDAAGLDLFKDIDGQAALIAACDLVVTISNTTAHLAGALGVPAWVLLPFGHFQPWYWFQDRTDSPWYPSVTLHRPSQFADWDNLLSRIAADLQRWLQRRS
ncbi:MAG: tetratricopeptide repeat protein [Rhodospirillaceae bacterium]|nr:tetratricopeptide repeat protein [Rhodospirillaceae bacterium]